MDPMGSGSIQPSMEVHENPGVLLGGSLAEWTTLTTPQKFNIAPEKLPKPDRKGSSSFPAIFQGQTSLNFGLRKKNMFQRGNSLASSPAAHVKNMWQGSTPTRVVYRI